MLMLLNWVDRLTLGPHVLAFHEDESVDWSDSFTPFCC